MRGNFFGYGFYILLVSFLVGCTSSTSPDENESTISDDLIQITKQQFESDNMKIGDVSIQTFEELLTCNGYIAAPPNGMAKISTLISGIVETIYCAVGDYVKKGEVLCKVSSTELLELQQNFTETSANLKRLKADWERSKALYEENIGAEKDYKAIESEYQITQARFQSLKLRLELLDLNTSKIEVGELFSAFPIRATISGYVISQQIVLGQFIEQQKSLMEIVDVNQLQLHLSVFETDINKLKIGQDIEFNSLGETGIAHYATLISIGKTIHHETKMINCIAKIKKEADYNFINQAYIEAKIFVDQTEARALPSDAILKADQQQYVLVLEKSDDQYYYLRKVKVDKGRLSNGFTEIVGTEDLSKVVIQGVYNLQVE